MSRPCVLCGASSVDQAGELKHEAACPHFMRGPDPGGDPSEWASLFEELEQLDPPAARAFDSYEEAAADAERARAEAAADAERARAELLERERVELERRDAAILGRERCDWCEGYANPGTTCPLSIACPHCGVPAGSSCRRPSDHRADVTHAARIQRAEELDELAGIKEG